MPRFLAPLPLLLLLTPLPGLGQSNEEFRVQDPFSRNAVLFRTIAPLEDIVGMTSQLTGSIQVNLVNLTSVSPRARFEVELSSLDTGVELRNADLRDAYLHTDQYPKAVFSFERIIRASASKLEPGKAVVLTAEGTFGLHGVTKKIVVNVTVTYLPETPLTRYKLPGNLLRISSQFDVTLADYKIETPEMLSMRIGTVAHVRLDAFASDASPQEMASWLKQIKKKLPPRKKQSATPISSPIM